MNPAPDTDPQPQQTHRGSVNNGHDEPPSNWLDALMLLLSSRISLIRLESKDVASAVVKRVLLMVAALLCVFFTWSLLLVAGITAVSNASGWHWHWVCLAAAALHLLVALLLARRARKPGAPAFPFTHTEFLKDREWIKNLQRIRKSGN